MHKDIDTLLQVQATDRTLKQLEAELTELPKRRAAIESQLSASQRVLEQRQSARQNHQAERKKIDRQIEDLRAKIEKSRSHSSSVKNNQEYRALLDEIAFAEGEISKCEERILTLMEESEPLEKQVRDAEAELAQARQGIAKEVAELEGQIQSLRQQREELLGRRKNLRKDLDAMLLRRYDRISELRGHGVAILDQETCGSCRVRFRPQFLQEYANQPDRIFLCESCGRILAPREQAEAAGH